MALFAGRAAWRSYYYPQTGSASSSGSLAKTSYKRARSSRKSSYKNYDNQYRPSRRFYPKPTVKDNYKPDPTTPVTAPPDPYYTTTTTPSSYPDQYRPTLSPFAKQFSQNLFHMSEYSDSYLLCVFACLFYFYWFLFWFCFLVGIPPEIFPI